MKNLFTAIFLCIAFLAQSQTGTLRGMMYEDATGEPVMFGTVLVAETGGGTTSDLDGSYTLQLDPGMYSLEFAYLGFANLTISEVEVKSGEVTVIDARLKEDSEVLEEVVITATQSRNTEAALATIKRKSINLLDGVSSQTFEKTGDGNAAEALQRVTGVSVEGGKHVYVRGLGDRYTKTILNGMDIPGLDPDKNSFEMDLFPTNLIDNILVFKSFTPDLPGDFTGGVVDVVTKDFPTSKFTNVSASAGYNPDMHFNDNYIRQERSGTDFLGFDDGLRKNPVGKNQAIPDPVLDDPILHTISGSFQDNAGVVRETSGFNKSLSFSTGNQYGTDVKYSYLLSLNYKQGSKFYDDAQFNTYIYDEQNHPGEYKLTADRKIIGAVGEESALLSGLVGFGLKLKNHRFGLHGMRLQNGISKAADQFDQKFQSSSAFLKREILEYAQREVTNVNLNGRHVLKDGGLTINWSAAPTIIQVDEPDIRFTAFERRTNGEYQIAPAVGADISRSWRNLKENNYVGKADVEFDFGKDRDRDNKLKVGIQSTYKNRDFGINNYIFRVNNQSELNLEGQAANIFNPENIWTVDTDKGVYVRGGFEAANTFSASQLILAGFAMNELEISDKLKAIYGVRVEKADNLYTGVNNSGTVRYKDEKVLDELNVLPAVNLIYAVGEASNIRASYSNTVARPTFKEKSIAQIQDRISGRTFIGNIDVKQSSISNFDLRFETFATGGQTFSVSGFYKLFKDPIELESYDETAPNNFTPRNISDQASVYGVEFETFKNLGFITPALSSLTAGANITFVQSEVDRSNSENLPDGESTRPMVGQSPLIINASLGYKNLDNGFEANMSFNRQAKKLLVAGFGSSADVYDQPFNSLNFKASKKFGPEMKYKLSVSADNILDDRKEQFYEAFSGDVEIYQSLAPGRTFSLGLSAKF